MFTDVSDDLLDRVRKLLAKAEGEGVTPHEAEALTAKAAELMAQQAVPAAGGRAKAWRRSWMLGYCTAVVTRVRAAEDTAVKQADASEGPVAGKSTALVLADRSLTVRRLTEDAYPRTRKTRVTYSGNGYGDGYREGQKADIGSTKIKSRAAGALSR
jgi:hypothetical protein